MTSLYSSLPECGNVSTLVSSSDSDAYTYDQSSGEITIFTEAVTKDGKTDSIVVQPFLTDYA